MSRLRIQLEGSLPWHPAFVSEAMMELFPKVEFLPYKEARKVAISLNLKGRREWIEYCKSGKKPHSMPSAPESVYRNKGWKGWVDFLGNTYLPFPEARALARSLGLTSQKRWEELYRSKDRPSNIPYSPHRIYKNDGWIGSKDFFNTEEHQKREREKRQKEREEGKREKIEYRSFEESRKFARSLKLRNLQEWREYCVSGKKPRNIHSVPKRSFKGKGWKGYKDFLGTKMISIKKASEFAIKNNIASSGEWFRYAKEGLLPRNVPHNPRVTYGEWTNWYDFLGKCA